MAAADGENTERRPAVVHWWLLAFVWGLAEATLFFIVPDVLLTWISAQVARRTAVIASVFAALGAVAGAAILLWWMRHDPAGVVSAVLALPGIDDDLLANVRGDVAQGWFRALVVGAFTGVPYKLFAVQASETGLTASAFLFASFAARLPRFLLTALAADLLAARLRRWARAGWIRPCWLIWWLGFYAVYFYAMGW